jgi:hypothetical protein
MDFCLEKLVESLESAVEGMSSEQLRDGISRTSGVWLRCWNICTRHLKPLSPSGFEEILANPNQDPSLS